MTRGPLSIGKLSRCFLAILIPVLVSDISESKFGYKIVNLILNVCAG
jgi:hypothetical protein